MIPTSTEWLQSMVNFKNPRLSPKNAIMISSSHSFRFESDSNSARIALVGVEIVQKVENRWEFREKTQNFSQAFLENNFLTCSKRRRFLYVVGRISTRKIGSKSSQAGNLVNIQDGRIWNLSKFGWKNWLILNFWGLEKLENEFSTFFDVIECEFGPFFACQILEIHEILDFLS